MVLDLDWVLDLDLDANLILVEGAEKAMGAALLGQKIYRTIL